MSEFKNKDSSRRELVTAGFKTADDPQDDAEFKTRLTIYRLLAAHQRSEPWDLKETITFFQAWTVKFVAEFKLMIEELALRVDKLPKRVLGMHRAGHNGFGLKNEVTLSREHITREPIWDVLGTLLHELLHVWQSEQGTPGSRKNEHNAEFRAKARACGLIVTEKGEQSYLPDSLFIDILRAHDVTIPDFGVEPIKATREERPGRSKLALWTCVCTPPQKARVGKKRFFARCTVCNELYFVQIQPEDRGQAIVPVV